MGGHKCECTLKTSHLKWYNVNSVCIVLRMKIIVFVQSVF